MTTISDVITAEIRTEGTDYTLTPAAGDVAAVVYTYDSVDHPTCTIVHYYNNADWAETAYEEDRESARENRKIFKRLAKRGADEQDYIDQLGEDWITSCKLVRRF